MWKVPDWTILSDKEPLHEDTVESSGNTANPQNCVLQQSATDKTQAAKSSGCYYMTWSHVMCVYLMNCIPCIPGSQGISPRLHPTAHQTLHACQTSTLRYLWMSGTPARHTCTSRSRLLPVLASRWWNDLHVDVRTAETLTTFKRRLKTLQISSDCISPSLPHN